MYLGEAYKGKDVVKAASKLLSPLSEEDLSGQPDLLEVWFSSCSDPGSDFTEFRLIWLDGSRESVVHRQERY